MRVFRMCQLRSQGVQFLNYEERVELWNLENEQFEELIIQPALSYYNRHFVRGQVQTDNGWGGKIFGIDYKKIILLVFNYYECHLIASEHFVINWKQLMDHKQH
ncbi:hypothetical protein Bca52824_022916 [Brassica carinata]|uniref:Uncharacterized protein n=1 Tax=Brassica carinata TaxID=52824 RepID=A0A8X7VHL0_BRACI|nr:hypothetical protein Bca52824_022916 [Brassica carinata]